MECSMEMKMQAVDEMLAVRKQLITMQDKVGMWNQVDDRTPLLIYNTEDFFEMAEYVGEKISSRYIEEGKYYSLRFTYNETVFSTQVIPKEYEKLKNKISEEEADA